MGRGRPVAHLPDALGIAGHGRTRREGRGAAPRGRAIARWLAVAVAAASGVAGAAACGGTGERRAELVVESAAGALEGASPEVLLRTLRGVGPAQATAASGESGTGRGAPLGTISGVVRTTLAPADTPVTPTHDLAACRPFRDPRVAGQDGALADAVVWLVGAPDALPAGDSAAPGAPRRAAIRLEGCRLEPRVQRLAAGGTLLVQSGDPMRSRLRFVPIDAPDEPPRAVLPLTDAGQVVPLPALAAAPGLLEVLDDLHPWVRGWVVVAPHRWTAVTGADGAFRFDGVPPGRWTLVAWHPVAGVRSLSVRLDPGVPTRLGVTLPAP